MTSGRTLRCLIADHAPYGAQDPEASGCRVPFARDGSESRETDGTESGRGLWLAARLTDELSISSGPENTIVSLYIRFE